MLTTINSGCRLFSALAVVFLCVLNTSPLHSQEEEIDLNPKDSVKTLPANNGQGRISVFIDCDGCDSSYLRQSIDFVNHVRDQESSQVHLFITRRATGSGGRFFSLSFIGKEEFEGIDNDLPYTSPPTNTRDEEREGLASIIKLGLISYLAHTSIAENITVEIPGASVNKIEDIQDPWNNWVFELYGGANFFRESRKGSLDVRYGFFADYVTSDWRIRLRPYFNYNQEDYVRDGEEIRSVMNRDGFQGRVIRSISSNWSLGAFTNVISNSYENIDIGYRIAPAIEYSLLPYRLALRKEYTIAYSLGYLHREYLEETIYGKMGESLYNQSLKFEVRVLQPWGTVRAGLEGSHFLHDLSKNRVSFESNFSVRIFKGFSVDFSADYDYVQDQLSLPRGDATLEEILLGQRQLATAYGVSVSAGISYRFGSIYNNVVNTRL